MTKFFKSGLILFSIIPGILFAKEGFVLVSNDKTQVKLAARISQAGMFTHDGNQSDLFFGNNNVSETRLNLTGVTSFNSDVSIRGVIELGIANNRLDKVTQMNHTPQNGDNKIVELRVADTIITSKKYGSFYIGHGSTASDTTAETDYSGISAAGEGSNTMGLGSALYFYNKQTSSYTNSPQVFHGFSNLDGLSRKSRVRYDTPSFNGFKVAGSISATSKRNIFDGGVFFEHKGPSAKVGASFGVSQKPGVNFNETSGVTFDGSSSILFNNGISATVAGGLVKNVKRKNPQYLYGKLGYQREICSCGKTYFAAGYGRYDNFNMDGDKGHSIGAAVLQNITKINTDVFIKYRVFKLDRSKNHFLPIHIVAIGTRIKL